MLFYLLEIRLDLEAYFRFHLLFSLYRLPFQEVKRLHDYKQIDHKPLMVAFPRFNEYAVSNPTSCYFI